ncbi:MAG TPA: hypothetical protein VFJ97_08150 [Dermatophilaceae bacterium]|nr:hypothetical protein [Dermatophilaceae bacterium]
MIDLVTEKVVSRGARTEPDLWRSRPRVRITSVEGSGRWAELELGDEIFVLRVDEGLSLVDSELWAEEQVELLTDLVNVAVAYLSGNCRRDEGKSLLGHRRVRLWFHVNGSDYVLK